MNKLEKQVYDILKHNPRLKLFVRNIYQRIFDLLPTPQTESAYEIQVREGFFFGFHDHTPFSPDNTKMLAHRYTIPLRMPELGETVDIGFFEGESLEEFKPLDKSRTWAWHLGSKLQWCGQENRIVFNDHIDGRNVARIVDIKKREKERILPDSIGSVSPDGHWAIGYSFSRVERCMPGYGYRYPVDDPEKDAMVPERHGIHLINLDNGKKELLFSIADIAKIDPCPSMDGAFHFFTHTIFSPNSKRFIFLHRWVVGGIFKRYSRLISCGIDGEGIHVFPTKDMVSHIGWRGADQVIAYCRMPIHDDQYVLFNDQEKDRFEIIGRDFFNSDGHPSFEPSGRWMVTDTYPDRRRVQNLIIYDKTGNRRYDIARLPMPQKYQSRPYKHLACDLHPRWDREGKRICFDSSFTGTRSLCFIDLGPDLEKGTLDHL